jgi:MoxR-like ATPase
MDNLKLVEQLNVKKVQLFSEIGKVIIGQEKVIEKMFISLLCQGHVLLEGVPGLAKTLLIKTLSDVLDLRFNRIQFTPDLMPSDITGTEIIEEDSSGKRAFKFFQGPIFANIILADEINRTPPKTQAALLEAMQEHKVTAGGQTYDLDNPFFVLATQNPIEQEGTYPLPEAQLDRFMFNLRIDYPKRSEEIDIVKATTSINHIELNHVINLEELIAFQQLVKNVPVADNVIEYAVDIVGKTRMADERAPKFVKDWLEWGAGPRASSYLILGAKSKAVLEGRTTPDIADVIDMIKPVLRHRVITNFNAESDGIKVDDILDRLIKESK